MTKALFSKHIKKRRGRDESDHPPTLEMIAGQVCDENLCVPADEIDVLVAHDDGEEET